MLEYKNDELSKVLGVNLDKIISDELHDKVRNLEEEIGMCIVSEHRDMFHTMVDRFIETDIFKDIAKIIHKHQKRWGFNDTTIMTSLEKYKEQCEFLSCIDKIIQHKWFLDENNIISELGEVIDYDIEEVSFKMHSEKDEVFIEISYMEELFVKEKLKYNVNEFKYLYREIKLNALSGEY